MHRECGCRATAQEEMSASSRLKFTPEQEKKLAEAKAAHGIAVGFASLKIILASIPASIWASFVTLKVWRWFAEPIGLPHMTMIPIMGLCLLIKLFQFSPLKSMALDYDERIKKDPGKFFKSYCWSAFLYPTIALLIGWICTLLR